MQLLVKRAVLLHILMLVPGCSSAKEEIPCWMTGDDSRVITTNEAILKSEFLATDLKQPAEDAKKRIAHGDYRVLIIGGFTGLYPAIDLEGDGEIVCEYGARFINGTSDGYDNATHAELVDAFREYAAAYNSFMLEYWHHSAKKRSN